MFEASRKVAEIRQCEFEQSWYSNGMPSCMKCNAKLTAIDFAISTVDRPENYIHRVISRLPRQISTRLVVGSPSYNYLEKYKNNPQIEIIGVNPNDWFRFENYPVKFRASWNYWRCLTLGLNPTNRRKGLLILEDDVLAAKGWVQKFLTAIDQIEVEYGSDYVLTLYTAYTELSKPIKSGQCYTRYPPSRFFGTQAMYYPESIRASFAEYMGSEGVTLFRMHYDVLLSEYLLRTGVPLFVTTPCLFEHIGAVGTGLAPIFHKAGRFSKTVKGKR